MSEVTIIYALERDAITQSIAYADGDSVGEVLERAKMKFPEIHFDNSILSSYGNKLSLNDSITKDMRIEVLRPLLITPTQARRLRAMRGSANRKSQRRTK